MLPHAGHQVFFHCFFNLVLQECFLRHDSAAKYDNFRIHYIADIGNSFSKYIHHLVNCTVTDLIVFFRLFENVISAPVFGWFFLPRSYFLCQDACCSECLEITVIHMHISNFTCTVAESVEHFTIQKDTAADSGSDRQHHCCLASCSRTCFILCKSGTVYIIFHFTWNSESFFYCLFKCRSDIIRDQRCRIEDFSFFDVHHTCSRDTHTCICFTF